MLIYESILDKVEDGRVDVRSAGDTSVKSEDDFNQEFAWTFASFDPSSIQTIYNYICPRLRYLLETETVSYSIGMFDCDDENIPDTVFRVGRLDTMAYALVIMYTPNNYKSVRLPLFIGATLYKAIRNCPWISADNDDEHYSLWKKQGDDYRLLDDYDFVLECCSDIKSGYNTQVGLVCNVFTGTVVDLPYDKIKEQLLKINRRKKRPVGELTESVLDGVEASSQGSAADKLANDMFLKRVAEEVERMIRADRDRKEYVPEIDLQKYVGVWYPEVAFDLRNAVLSAVKFFGRDCNLNWINPVNVSDMSHLFNIGDAKRFNGDISLWDTSGAVFMNGMFEDSEFNGDISEWNVSGVKEMHKMFTGSKFNGDLS